MLISANNNQNAFDLDGNEIKGKLYYLDAKGNRVFIRMSELDAASASNSTLAYSVNWDVSNVDEGEYTVIFVTEDPDGAKAECEGIINVTKVVPEKITNVRMKEITDYTVGGYNCTAGEKTVTLSYDGFTAEFTANTIHKAEWHVTTESSCSEAGIESEICSV